MKRKDLAPGDPVFWNRTYQGGTMQVPGVVRWLSPHLVSVSVATPDGKEIVRHVKAECLSPGIGYKRRERVENVLPQYLPGEKRPTQNWSAGE